MMLSIQTEMLLVPAVNKHSALRLLDVYVQGFNVLDEKNSDVPGIVSLI